MRYAFLFIGGLLAVLALTWIIQGNEFFLYKTFAPRQEAVRRQTFEQSKAYNDGMAQELRSMQFQYEQADPKHKDALAYIILHRVANYDESRLSPELQSFVASLRSNGGVRR